MILLAAATVVAGTSSAYAQKNPAGVNPTHYQCYRVVARQKPPFKQRVVTLRDQFGRSRAEVVQPEFLCTPTYKDKSKPKDTKTHYLCYEEKRASERKPTVEVINQFGKAIFVVAEPRLLCVPSLKRVIKK